MEPRAGDMDSMVNYAARLIEKQAAVVHAARMLLGTEPEGLLDGLARNDLRCALDELDAEFAFTPRPLAAT